MNALVEGYLPTLFPQNWLSSQLLKAGPTFIQRTFEHLTSIGWKYSVSSQYSGRKTPVLVPLSFLSLAHLDTAGLVMGLWDIFQEGRLPISPLVDSHTSQLYFKMQFLQGGVHFCIMMPKSVRFQRRWGFAQPD